MKNKEAILLAAIIIGFGLLAYVLYNFAKPDDLGEKFSPVLPEDVEVAMEGVSRVTATENGEILWTIKNDGLLYMDKISQVNINHPEAMVPVKDGGTVEVRGEEGAFFMKTENFSLKDNIEIKMDKNKKREWVMKGASVDYFRESDNFHIQDIHGAMYPQDGGTMEVSGKEGEYFNKTDNFKLSENIKIKMDRDKRSEWVMEGSAAEYFHKDEIFTISDLFGFIYPESGGTVDVKGNKAVYRDREKLMNLSGDVVCKLSDGTIIMTDDLDFAIEKNTVTTDSKVNISGKGFRLSGTGMYAETQAKKFKLEKSVKLVLDKGFGALK